MVCLRIDLDDLIDAGSRVQAQTPASAQRSSGMTRIGQSPHRCTIGLGLALLLLLAMNEQLHLSVGRQSLPLSFKAREFCFPWRPGQGWFRYLSFEEDAIEIHFLSY